MAEFRLPVIDYQARDYESTRQLLIDLIQFFTPEWTDHNASDFGIVQLEEFAVASDILHFYLDRVARQCFLPTLTTRRAAVNLLKLIDYELASAQPARVGLVFTLAQLQVADVSIPLGTRVRTGGDIPVVFETDSELVIPAGKYGNEMAAGVYLYMKSATEGTATDETVDDSDGSAFQARQLTSRVILDSPFNVYVDEGSGYEAWTEVDSFVLSDGTAKHYTRERDENDIVTVKFGDNGSGKIPAAGAQIYAEFRIITDERGGTDGNVGAGTATTLVTPITLGGNPVTLSVTNPEQAQEGEPREDIETARVQGPRSLRAMNRAVSKEDYKTHAEGYAGVAKAQIMAGDLPYAVDIAIIPEGGGSNPVAPTQTLKDNLKTYLEGMQVFYNALTIESPEFVTVELEGTVVVLSNYRRAQVETAVKAAINTYFDSETGEVDFAKAIYFSDLDRIVDSVAGVDHVEWARMTIIPPIHYEVRGGDYTIASVAISETTKRETWTVYFTAVPPGGPYQFNVRGSVSGLQAATGEVGVIYTSDNNEVRFTVVLGTAPPTIYDRITFRTSTLIGSVYFEDKQFPVLGFLGNLFFTGGSA